MTNDHEKIASSFCYVFAAGVLCSYWGIIPECDDSLSLYILYVMMFLVGIGLGSDLTALSAPIKKI